MSTPLNKIIFNEIEDRLSNVSTENGYATTFKRIERGATKPFKSHDLIAVNFWPSTLSNENDKYNRDNRSIQLFFQVQSKTMDEPFVDVCDRLGSDLVTGLNRSTTAPLVSDVESDDLGELVDNFIFNGYDYQVGEGQTPWCGILAKFTVVYSTTLNNMTV